MKTQGLKSQLRLSTLPPHEACSTPAVFVAIGLFVGTQWVRRIKGAQQSVCTNRQQKKAAPTPPENR